MKGFPRCLPSCLVFVCALFILVAQTAHAKHPAIYLLDPEGEIIDPISDENDDKPVSTKQTCGMCHDYDEITQGYHFQMGWDVVSDTFGVSMGKPWVLSDGFMGKWYPYAFRQLAKKVNAHPDEIDVTSYDFIGFSRTSSDDPPCGACHPGGGGLEYDREGNRYDEYLAENPELMEELDGDYYKSEWDKSGVVEADCFLCHFEGYDFEERVNQLESGNYKWASVAATRLGVVDGYVSSGDEPVVIYNERYFNNDGTIEIDVSWPPPSENCLFCHGKSSIKKRGFSWYDLHNPDIHNQQGMSCSSCHPSDISHQFAKGNSNTSTVADHLDNSMMSCQKCHENGYLGATIPEHALVRPSHLKAISCEACHIPGLSRSATLGYELVSDEQRFIPNPPDADGFGEIAEWRPVYERREDGRIFPFNSVISVWWGNIDSDGILYPLFLREHEEGWDVYSDQLSDDNEDGELEVNTPDEIIAGLNAFKESLEGNERFDVVNPALVKGQVVYSLDDEGNLVEGPYSKDAYVNFSISHNVAPTRFALGSNGCKDCHIGEPHFFKGQRVLDFVGADGMMITRSNGRAFGCNPAAFWVNSFHQKILSPLVSIGLVVVVFLVTIHYHSYGPKHIQFVPDSGEIKRFSIFERGVHLFRLISFIFLTVTGLIMAFNWTQWQELLFSSPKQMLDLHIGFGVVFIVTTLLGAFIWFRDALFASYDKIWVRIIGGYLGYKGEVPAGRFNAGQKMFYWYTTVFGFIMILSGLVLTFKSGFPLSVICITSTIHNLAGFVLIAGVLSHAYLGTIANPGTWRVLVDGYVTREWAEHHHKYWLEKLEKVESEVKEESGDEETDSNGG